MKLSYNKNSKDPIYYIQQGIRNGKKTTTRNVKRIGKHSELLRITDDPLSYAKEQVKKYNEEIKNNKVNIDLKIDFDEKVRSSENIISSSNNKNVGYFYLQKIYNDLKIKDFFESIKTGRKITFDPNLINRFLTYARILDPSSKYKTFTKLDNYFEEPLIDYHHMLRFMDFLSDHYDDYISHLFKESNNVVKRDTSVCYFDCSNFYFEIEENDEDYFDEVTGELIKGFRKYGPSKEHRPNPLIEMGLFMDSQGIPLSMCIAPGSDNEQTLALPLEKKLSKMLNGKSFIYCADAGLGSYNIRKFNSMGGKAYVITQSIKKLSDVLQQAVFNDDGYKLLSDNSSIKVHDLQTFDKNKESFKRYYSDKAYKILEANTIIDTGLTELKLLKNGKKKEVKIKGTIKQKIIVTFSRKMMEYQRHIRNKQIERAKILLKKKDPEDIKKGPNDVRRFIKNTASELSYELDEELIANEEKYDGYYAIATNLEDDAQTIINIAANRYKIEDCFRILKTNFDARPVYHHKKERIIAHFLICYTALLIYRLLEIKLDEYGTHFTTNSIVETLRNMNVCNMQDLYYTAAYDGSQVLTSLSAIYDLGLDKKYYKCTEINKKIKKIT